MTSSPHFRVVSWFLWPHRIIEEASVDEWIELAWPSTIIHHKDVAGIEGGRSLRIGRKSHSPQWDMGIPHVNLRESAASPFYLKHFHLVMEDLKNNTDEVMSNWRLTGPWCDPLVDASVWDNNHEIEELQTYCQMIIWSLSLEFQFKQILIFNNQVTQSPKEAFEHGHLSRAVLWDEVQKRPPSTSCCQRNGRAAGSQRALLQDGDSSLQPKEKC